MEQSILKSTKKALQIGDDDESFDLDVMTHINSAFSDLNDLGVGPDEGFTIEDADAEWEEFLQDNQVQLNRVKMFVFLRTRLLFDPPATTFHLSALQEQLKETTWRLSINREAIDWVDPTPPVLTPPPITVLDDGEVLGDFDGGGAG